METRRMRHILTMNAVLSILCMLCMSTAASMPVLTEDNAVVPSAYNSTIDYLHLSLNAIARALGFFQKAHRDVNLDAVIGTRLVEASFSIIIKKLETSDLMGKVPEDVVYKLEMLQDLANQLSRNINPYVMAFEPDYFASLGPILAEGFFELDYEGRNINKTVLIWPAASTEVLNQSISDKCIEELLGTNSVKGIQCSVSSSCWKLMTGFGYSGYSLTHEIFYLQIAERNGCWPQMNRHLKNNNQESLKHVQDTLCANMFAQANDIASADFPAQSQDLFMEQTAFCGMLGYRDFFNQKWLDKILSWQDNKDGCYKFSSETSPSAYSGLRFLRARTKREEKVVSRGCLCHRTTVAVAALAQFVRYILEAYLEGQS